MEQAKTEMTKCDRTEMTHDTMSESRKPVYVTVLSDQYSDIFPEEACELEYENVSDEEELEKMVTDPNPEDRDILSVSSSLLEDIMREDPAVNVDDFLCGDSDFEFRGEDREQYMEDEEYETPVPTEDSDMDTTNETGSASETTVISLTLIKIETVYPDGTSEVVRNTSIAHSRNVDPVNVDFANIAMEIITEVPHHFNNRHVRVVNSVNSTL
ncbi:uncharacterized protein LOC134275122 [Saccostrea cucullata]|uniref:uncharacterized protein LOC134275122 n=1 Tax=Saccostrea cuccullata TaxID=36930 RepID=UPI002ECFDDBC